APAPLRVNHAALRNVVQCLQITVKARDLNPHRTRPFCEKLDSQRRTLDLMANLRHSEEVMNPQNARSIQNPASNVESLIYLNIDRQAAARKAAYKVPVAAERRMPERKLCLSDLEIHQIAGKIDIR